jgi:hypothetical protein
VSFTERIAVVIDVTADKATKGMKDFKSSFFFSTRLSPNISQTFT